MSVAVEEVPSVPAALLAATQSPPEKEEESQERPVEEMDTTEHSAAAANGEEKRASPAPSSPPSSLTSPLLPLPDFMTALNMMPSGQPPGDKGAGEGVEPEPPVEKEELTLGPGPKEVLIEKFKQNPNGVLDLLQSALSMEKLSTLLQEEHRGDSELLLQLQNRLEAAYHTLRECEETKAELAKKISESNQQVAEKRKHLEELRGELKILGDQELRLKRKRDHSHSKYSQLKKKLTCSTEALEQISLITKLMDPASSGSATPTSANEEEDGNDGEITDAIAEPPTTEAVAMTTEAIAMTTEAAATTTEAIAPMTGVIAMTTEATAPMTGVIAMTTEATAPMTEAIAMTTEATAPTTEAIAMTTEVTAPTTGVIAMTTEAIGPMTEAMTTEATVPTTGGIAMTTEGVTTTTEATPIAIEAVKNNHNSATTTATIIEDDVTAQSNITTEDAKPLEEDTAPSDSIYS